MISVGSVLEGYHSNSGFFFLLLGLHREISARKPIFGSKAIMVPPHLQSLSLHTPSSVHCCSLLHLASLAPS